MNSPFLDCAHQHVTRPGDLAVQNKVCQVTRLSPPSFWHLVLYSRCHHDQSPSSPDEVVWQKLELCDCAFRVPHFLLVSQRAVGGQTVCIQCFPEVLTNMPTVQRGKGSWCCEVTMVSWVASVLSNCSTNPLLVFPILSRYFYEHLQQKIPSLVVQLFRRTELAEHVTHQLLCCCCFTLTRNCVGLWPHIGSNPWLHVCSSFRH